MDFYQFINDNMKAGKSKDQIIKEVTEQANKYFDVKEKEEQLKKEQFINDLYEFIDLVENMMDRWVGDIIQGKTAPIIDFTCNKDFTKNEYIKDFIANMIIFFHSLKDAYHTNPSDNDKFIWPRFLPL